MAIKKIKRQEYIRQAKEICKGTVSGNKIRNLWEEYNTWQEFEDWKTTERGESYDWGISVREFLVHFKLIPSSLTTTK